MKKVIALIQLEPVLKKENPKINRVADFTLLLQRRSDLIA